MFLLSGSSCERRWVSQIDGIPEPATALAEEKVLHIKMKQHAAAAIGLGTGKKKAGGKKKKGKKKKKKK